MTRATKAEEPIVTEFIPVLASCEEFDEAGELGFEGTVGARGETAALATEDAEVPPATVAVEVNVYERPLVKPVTSQEVLGRVTVQVCPVFAVTV